MTTIATQAALSGLKAAQRALDTISGNIANASTEGYTRKILPQESLIVAGSGIGVKSMSLIRNVDKALMRDLFKQVSVASNSTVQEDFLSRIQTFHGASDAGRSLSARVGNLADSFAELSSSPDNSTLLNKTINTAQALVNNFRDYAKLVSDLRGEADSGINNAVNDTNQILEKIADLNRRIGVLTSQEKSTADFEDQRDMALRQLSNYMQISTFTSDNNKITVMTKQGQVLADETARTLYFNPTTPVPTSYYPGGGLSGVTIDSPTGIEIAPENMGGSLGALFTLRDDTLPMYQAQVDEMAQKLAERFDAQGLRLFTDANGNVPASVAPPAAVSYVGFANNIRVNQDVLDDPTLLRQGTTGAAVQPGSNEIIRKISEFTFGAFAGQAGTGTADISVGTIFAATGMQQVNRLIGNMDITDFAPDLDAAPNITAPASFTLDIGGTGYGITINPGDTATDLVNNINAAVGSNVAALNGLGQLRLDTAADITLIDGGIGIAGMADLGFAFGVTPATNPSFTVQVGGQSPVTVTIAPGDTSATLLAQLNAISGITATLDIGGELLITPDNGGGLLLVETNGTPLQDMGVTVGNVAHTAFRTANMGPAAGISTGLTGNNTLEDFVRGLISSQAEDHSLTRDTMEKESSFLESIDQRNMNQSGVNIDEEISELIRIQTAYSAAARMISSIEKTLDDLFAAFSGF
jgi:flagellar hook-associated protein 1 FlgK